MKCRLICQIPADEKAQIKTKSLLDCNGGSSLYTIKKNHLPTQRFVCCRKSKVSWLAVHPQKHLLALGQWYFAFLSPLTVGVSLRRIFTGFLTLTAIFLIFYLNVTILPHFIPFVYYYFSSRGIPVSCRKMVFLTNGAESVHQSGTCVPAVEYTQLPPIILCIACCVAAAAYLIHSFNTFRNSRQSSG